MHAVKPQRFFFLKLGMEKREEHNHEVGPGQEQECDFSSTPAGPVRSLGDLSQVCGGVWSRQAFAHAGW